MNDKKKDDQIKSSQKDENNSRKENQNREGKQPELFHLQRPCTHSDHLAPEGTPLYGLTWSETYRISQHCACESRSRFNRWSQPSRQSNRAEVASEDGFLSITNKLVQSILRTSLWQKPSAFQSVFGSQPVKQAWGGMSGMNGLISILWILKTESSSKADILYYVTM